MSKLPEENENDLVCSECGNVEIETLAWVNPNTKVYISSQEGDDRYDNWCSKCEDHVDLITRTEFKERQDEQTKS